MSNMQKINIVIFGSCVSRDAIEYFPQAFKLIDYFARSSIAGIGTEKATRLVDLGSVASSFQKKILCYELSKEALARLCEADYDVLLMDLIDERFALLSSGFGESVFTLSNEMLNTDIKHVYRDLNRVEPLSDKYFELWEKGWVALIDALKRKNYVHKLLINKAYWAESDSDGADFNDNYREGWIERNNAFLSKMYDRMSCDINGFQFLQVAPALMIADKGHKWGRSPFHYVPDFYQDLVTHIRIQCGGTKPVLARQLLLLPCSSSLDIVQYEENKNCSQFAYMRSFYDQVFGSGRDEIIRNSLHNADVSVISPRTGKDIPFLGSTYLAGRNFLFFNDDGVLAIVVQHHKFCRALYYPALQKVIKFDPIDLPLSCFHELYKFARDKVHLYDSYFSSSASLKSAGLLVSYGRPYHYFYDSLPAALDYKDHIADQHQIMAIEGDSFFPAHKLFGKESTTVFKSYDDLSEYLLLQNKYLVLPGYSLNRSLDVTRFDELILKVSHSALKQAESKLLTILSSASNVLWLGICVEKRVWAEQVSTIRSIISAVLDRDPQAVFVFDGLTCPDTSDVHTFRTAACSKELAILEQIISGLISNDNIIDLIGATAQTKLACASYVNVFLSSFLTDSMYVARFNNKKGVGYGACKAMHTDHIHPDTWFVPRSWVVDDERKSRNWSEISYSINPTLIKSLFLSVWDGKETTIELHQLHKAMEAVSFTSAGGGTRINANTGLKHKLVALDQVKSLVVPANKGAVVRFLGAADRKLSVSALVSISSNRIFDTSKSYLSLGQTLYVAPADKQRNLKFAVRVKGSGSAVIDNLSLIYLDEDPVAEQDATKELVDKITVVENLGALRDIFSLKVGSHDYIYSETGGCINFRYVNKNSNNLLVFFHAALTRTSASRMPAFAGNNAVGIVNANILMISDPSITNENDLSLAWYAGSERFPCQGAITRLIKAIVEATNSRRAILYGDSGGGFASLYYGNKLPESISICANPQINIAKYSEVAVSNYLNECFPSIEKDSLEQRLLSTGIDFRVKAEEQKNTVVYLQNEYDTHHVANHLGSFWNSSTSPVSGRWNGNVFLYCSKNWGRGHAAPPRKMVFELINYLFSEQHFSSGLVGKMPALDAQHSSLISKVTLEQSAGLLVCKIARNEGVSFESEKYAFYLLKDGQRIGYIPYGPSSTVSFCIDSASEAVMYQAVGFVRNKAKTSSIKSNKLFI